MRVATVAAAATVSTGPCCYKILLTKRGERMRDEFAKTCNTRAHTTLDLAINANEKNIRISVNKSPVLLLFGTHTIREYV